MQGAKAIADMLKKNSNLRVIELNNNMIDYSVCSWSYPIFVVIEMPKVSKLIPFDFHLEMEVGIYKSRWSTSWEWHYNKYSSQVSEVLVFVVCFPPSFLLPCYPNAISPLYFLWSYGGMSLICLLFVKLMNKRTFWSMNNVFLNFLFSI